MTNKSLAMWIVITGVTMFVFALGEADETITGFIVWAFAVFSFMAASRLNKLTN